MVSTNCPMVSTNCPLALPQNGCRQSIVLYLRRWKEWIRGLSRDP